MKNKTTPAKIDRQSCDHHSRSRVSWKIQGVFASGLLAFVFSACGNQPGAVVQPVSPSPEAAAPASPGVAASPVAPGSTTATSPTTTASPGATTGASPTPLTKPLTELNGQTVTVSTKVQEVITPNLFTVYDVESLRGQTVLVVSKTPAPPVNTNIEITGVVGNFVVADAEKEYGIEVTPEVEQKYVNKPYLAAAAIEKVD